MEIRAGHRRERRDRHDNGVPYNVAVRAFERAVFKIAQNFAYQNRNKEKQKYRYVYFAGDRASADDGNGSYQSDSGGFRIRKNNAFTVSCVRSPRRDDNPDQGTVEILYKQNGKRQKKRLSRKNCCIKPIIMI